MSFALSNVRSFPQFAIVEMTYPPSAHFDKHVDGHSRISIVIRGQLKESASGEEVYAKTGSLVFKPGDLVHQNTFGPSGSRVLSVIFKDGFFENEMDAKIEDWRWYHGASVATTSIAFARRLRDVSDEEENYEALVELIANLSAPPEHTSADIPPWLMSVEEKIRDDYKNPIRTKNLAAIFGVHPVYLARAFRKHYGYSVKGFLQKIRLEHALHELSEGKKPLIQIALDAGFSDQSHLNRVFRNNMEMSPGTFRKWTFA